ncbi:MAG: aconitate hydratase [Deltaproteobacteria bacterium]|nr:aconitate hydratase [Deltaproteobacteria bacterium]
MGKSVTMKLIESHLVSGEMRVGEEIGIRIDQTLTQDATGTMVMLALESMGLDRVKTDISVQYVDHNLLQVDNKNADDHLFLWSACQRFGLWYSRPGNGVSHPVHQERFGKPGATMLGSDSHTPAAGAIGMLAIGAGGLEVALAMSGEPFYFKMPEVWGVELIGSLPPWISAKDVILEMLRRHGVKGGIGRIIEYYGDGLNCLSAMDRHVIANMGAELGATSSVFPSDGKVREFFVSQGREADFKELIADSDAAYVHRETIDLSKLVPLIAMPSSPDNVVPVEQVEGQKIGQAYIGSSANPGYRDFAIAAEIVKGRRVQHAVSFDINPTSRQVLENLALDNRVFALISSGARIHQAGCNGCIGMGQAPASGSISLRTVPRNFPGRSGTQGDKIYLVSPETAAASALTGVITDPRTLDMPYPDVREPEKPITVGEKMFLKPLSPSEARDVELVRGPNISPLPDFEPPPDLFGLPVLLKMGDNVSTDEILPAGARVLPFRSNIPKISEFAFSAIDSTYHSRALEARDAGGHAVVGGLNYGQGSSREHAALAPRFLGLRVVLAKSFARIHWQNLINWGVIPLTFESESDYDNLQQGDQLRIENLGAQLTGGQSIELKNETRNVILRLRHVLSDRQTEMVLAGGLVNIVRARLNANKSSDERLD